MVAIWVFSVATIFLTMAINLNEVKAVRKLLGIIMPTLRVTVAAVAFFYFGRCSLRMSVLLKSPIQEGRYKLTIN
jgi:hypothetical protein